MLWILFINSPIQSLKCSLFNHLNKSPLIYKINTHFTDNNLYYRVISLALSYSMQSSKTLTLIYTIYFSKFYFLRKLLIFMHSYFGLQTVPLTNELTRRPSILQILPGSILWYHDLIVTSPLVTLETDQSCVSVGVCWWCLCRTSRTRTCCRRSVAGSDQTADWVLAPLQKTQGAPWGAPCVGTKWFVSESPVVF